MTKETQTKQCPCCTNNPEGLMFWTGNGWHCTVCSYTEFEPEVEIELEDYKSVPPKRSFEVSVIVGKIQKGTPLKYYERDL